jgi:4-hydroxybenzoate polyprenyltransferase
MFVKENNLPFIRRFWIYQNERFPFLANGLFLSAFAFSAISYSRICRGATGFVEWRSFLAAAISTIAFFFLLRIADEFKDQKEDAQYRPFLPVPRGLISFQELRWMGAITVAVLFLVNWWLAPQMMYLLLIPFGFLLLIANDFFVSDWLNRHWELYVFSHMFFFPAIDTYSSGMDWYLEGPGQPPFGMIFFFAVSYLNGLVWEVGRKIKAPENEEHNSYSKRYGLNRSLQIWMVFITIAYGCALLASFYAGNGWLGLVVLTLIFLFSLIHGIRFIQRPDSKRSKWVELASGGWGLFMYLALGALPMLIQFFKA